MDVRTSMVFLVILLLSVISLSNSGRIGIRKLLQSEKDTDVCPLPKCAAPPDSACTEPAYRVINGVRCPWCYKIVPCTEKSRICLTCCGPPPCCNYCGNLPVEK